LRGLAWHFKVAFNLPLITRATDAPQVLQLSQHARRTPQRLQR
jgi:hypothetical protein